MSIPKVYLYCKTFHQNKICDIKVKKTHTLPLLLREFCCRVRFSYKIQCQIHYQQYTQVCTLSFGPHITSFLAVAAMKSKTIEQSFVLIKLNTACRQQMTIRKLLYQYLQQLQYYSFSN